MHPSAGQSEPDEIVRWDVFLVHASPDKALAREIFRELEALKLRVFLDEAVLLPGDDWQSAIPAHLAQSRIIVVLVSSNSPAAWYENSEIASAINMARENGRRLVPVKLTPDARVPYGLEQLHHIELGSPPDFADAARRLALVAGSPTFAGRPHVRDAPPNRFWVDTPPPDTLPRSDDVDAAVRLIIGAAGDPVIEHPRVCITGIRGAGGIGKTILARLLAQEKRVWQFFPGGIFWASVGEDPDVVVCLSTLYYQASGRVAPAAVDLSRLTATALGDRKCLVILDDVWHSNVVDMISGAFPPSVSVLYTSRGVRVESASIIELGKVAEAEARSLLTRGRRLLWHIDDELLADIRADIDRLAQLMGGWALLLDLAGRHLASVASVEDHEAFRSAIRNLESDFERDPTVLEDPENRERSLSRLIGRSLQFLGEDSEKFSRLAVFPADAHIGLDVLEDLWEERGTAVAVIAQRLDRAGLATLFPARQRTPAGLRLHDLVVAYLHHEVGAPSSETLRHLHLQAARVLLAHPPDPSALTPGRAEWLSFHARAAGRDRDLLVLAGREWLEAFLRATGSHAAYLDVWTKLCQLWLEWRSREQEIFYICCRVVLESVREVVRVQPAAALIAEARLGHPTRALLQAVELEASSRMRVVLHS